MKCLDCVLGNLDGMPVHNNISVVEDAVEAAKTAVVVRNGEALCAFHLRQRLVAEAVSKIGT